MVVIIYVYVNKVFGYLWVLFFFFNCLVGCLNIIFWTPAALGVLYICTCFVFLYLHLFTAIEHVSHGKVL